MTPRLESAALAAGAIVLAAVPYTIGSNRRASPAEPATVMVHAAVARDVSPSLLALVGAGSAAPGNAFAPDPEPDQGQSPVPIAPPVMASPPGSGAVEQTSQGERPPAALVASFDGLGVGFDGPHGVPLLRNPSDNSLAVGPDHIVQTINSRMAVFTKKGKRFATTGKALYGAVATNNVFRGFGGSCGEINNGDAVVRYDQLANRWLIVMPIFRRAEARPDQPAE